MISRRWLRKESTTWFGRHFWNAWKRSHPPSRRSVALRAEALEDRFLPSLAPPDAAHGR